MKCITSVILILLTSPFFGECARILALFSSPGRSHYILGSSLTKALAEKGHDVTMISAYGEKEPPKVKNGYRDIVVKEVLDSLEELKKNFGGSMFDQAGTNPFLSLIFIGIIMSRLQEEALKNEEVQKLIHSDEKFDVVIVEQFMNDAQKALAAHFGAPLIVMGTVGANNILNAMVGNPSLPSYIPNMMLDYSPPLSFSERLINSVLAFYQEIFFHLYLLPSQNAMIQKYIPNGADINDVIYNTSIVLLNSHNSLNTPVPYVPNMIDIGGFHVKPPKKLPKDLQDFLDNAKNGVVYFSMGSNLKSAEFPAEKRDAFLKTFAKLKEKVLWKWEEDVLPGQPSNVKLGKWLPQQDILAHPNVKLFITHGGYLSTTETIYYGVPILAIPIFGDQEFNAKIAVDSGYGRMLPYQEITEEKLTYNIQELLNNPKYRNNAKQKSNLFHDRIRSPMDTAIYWVEYVIRHKGAQHLRVAALNLPWYKYHLLDVIAVIAVVAFILLFISCYSIKLVCRKLFSKSKKVKKS